MGAWGGAARWSSEAGGEEGEGEGEGREGGGASPSSAWFKRCARRTQHLMTKPLDIRDLKNAAAKTSKTRKKQCSHATTDANITAFPNNQRNATPRLSARAIMQRANTFGWLHVDGVENQRASITRHQRRWGKRFAAACIVTFRPTRKGGCSRFGRQLLFQHIVTLRQISRLRQRGVGAEEAGIMRARLAHYNAVLGETKARKKLSKGEK